MILLAFTHQTVILKAHISACQCAREHFIGLRSSGRYHHYFGLGPGETLTTNDQYQNQDSPDNADLLVLWEGSCCCQQRGLVILGAHQNNTVDSRSSHLHSGYSLVSLEMRAGL